MAEIDDDYPPHTSFITQQAVKCEKHGVSIMYGSSHLTLGKNVYCHYCLGDLVREFVEPMKRGIIDPSGEFYPDKDKEA